MSHQYDVDIQLSYSSFVIVKAFVLTFIESWSWSYFYIMLVLMSLRGVVKEKEERKKGTYVRSD